MRPIPNSPPTPRTPSVLVLEKSSFWSAELNRQFVREGVSVRARSRIEDLTPLLETGTVGQLLIGLEMEPPVVLRLFSDLRDKLRNTRVIVLVPAENLELEWSLRELGAAEVVPAPVSADQLTSIIRRGFLEESHSN